jgi:chemotaxis protein CheD
MNRSSQTPKAVYLKPGELYIGKTPARVTTILGSCVSVTMFHQLSKLAAICHAILPEWSGKLQSKVDRAESFKYVNLIIPEMIRKIKQRRTRLEEIEVKLFGGADIVSDGMKQARIQSIGVQNTVAAIRMIECIGLDLKVANTGGPWGRKIIFCTRTGEVFMKYLKQTDLFNT